MATIRQVPSGFWQGIIRKKGNESKSKTFQLKRDCEQWATDTEAQMNRGVYNDLSAAESLTIREGLSRYLIEFTPHKKDFETETYRIKAMIKEPYAKKTLASFGSADLAKIRNDKIKAGFAASTVNKTLTIISQLYEKAAREWRIPCVNPKLQVANVKVNNSRVRRLSDIEIKYLTMALLDDAAGGRKNDEVYRVVMFAIETAMRQGKIVGLYWSDIDLKKKTATIIRKGQQDAAEHHVPLSTAAIKILIGEDDVNVTKIRRGKVFNSTASAIKQSYSKAVKRARRYYELDYDEAVRDDKVLRDLTFHDLRHEAASRLFESGKFDTMEVAAITGHKTLQTLKRYTHFKAEELAKKLG